MTLITSVTYYCACWYSVKQAFSEYNAVGWLPWNI